MVLLAKKNVTCKGVEAVIIQVYQGGCYICTCKGVLLYVKD